MRCKLLANKLVRTLRASFTTTPLTICMIAMVVGCQKLEPKKTSKRPHEATHGEHPESTDPLEENDNGEEGKDQGDPNTWSFAAEYNPVSIDAVVLIDAALSSESLDTLNYAANALAARLSYTELDVRLWVASQGGENQEDDPATGSMQWRQTEEGNPFLLTDGNGIRERAFQMLYTEQTAANPLAFSDTLDFLKNSQEIAASERFVSILLITESVTQEETVNLVNGLNQWKGVEAWSLSALLSAPMDENEDPQGRCQEINGGSWRFLFDAVQDSGGTQANLCQDSYAQFFSNYLIDATNSRYFYAKIPANLDSNRLSVTTDETIVTGWIYNPESGRLLLPRTIQTGAEVIVQLVPNDKTVPPDVEQEPQSPTPPTAPPTSPDEMQRFAAEIAPILQNNCDGAGCHGEGAGNQQYVGQFQLVKQRRDSIKQRVERPEGDPLRMPPAGMDAEDMAKLLGFLETLND